MKSFFGSQHLSALFLLALAWRVFAESIPPFDLDTQASKASIIVLGRLQANGELHAAQVLKGTPTTSGVYLIDGGVEEFKHLAKTVTETGDAEVIAFLSDLQADGSFRLVSGYTAVVGVSSQDQVFAWLAESAGFGGLQAHPSWTKATFVAELKRSLQTNDELEALLAKPRSKARMMKMIAFLREHAKPPPEGLNRKQHWYGRGYFFNQAMQKLHKPDAEEEQTLAGQLQQARVDEEKELLLAIINGVHASRALYETVLPFAEATVPAKVRREALSTLATLDPHSAAAVLARYLKIDEPELDYVLTTLGQCGYMHDPRLLNTEVIAPLEALGREIFEKSRAGYDINNANCGRQVLSALGNYFHPAFLPLMHEWANDSSVSTWNQAASVFGSVLGRSQLPEDPVRIRQWWEQNQGKVTRSYNLSTWAGVSEWMREYRASPDTITESVLLRLWDFQPTIPEKELLEACKGDDAAMAKSLLSKLWQRRRLTPETRLAIVRDYLRLKIKRDTPRSKDDKWQELRVVPDRQFPFPHDAWVNHTGEVTTRWEPQIRDRTSFGSQSLESVKYFASVSDGEVGKPAKAMLELWETDYQTSPPREIWRMRWEVNEQDCGVPKIIKPPGQ